MPGDPKQCRFNAARCLSLAKRSASPERREHFAAMAEIWNKLAAENASDETLLDALSELKLGEPYESLPFLLNIHSRASQ